MRMPLDIAYSVCPHDCPSACALAVERIDGRHIGRVRGAAGQSYTQGVVCAKVARYAERQHHPERLSVPLRRVGEKGSGHDAFVPISWDDALDEVAEQLTRAAQRHGSETVWPHYYAGTMGLVQRDGQHRLRHAMRYSRQNSTICVALTDAGWLAGVGAKRGADAREMAKSDLIVVWGGNPVSTQVNVMTQIAQARKERGAKLVVIDPYRTGTAEIGRYASGVAAGHRRRARLRRDACAVQGRLRRPRLPGALHRRSRRARSPSRDPHAGLGGRDHRACRETRSSHSPGSTARRSAASCGSATVFRASATARCRCSAASCLPAVTGAWQYEGGGALYSQHNICPDRPHADRGQRSARPGHPHPRPVPHRADPVRRQTRPRRRAAGHGAVRPEHEPDGGLARFRRSCIKGSRATICSSASTSSS